VLQEQLESGRCDRRPPFLWGKARRPTGVGGPRPVGGHDLGGWAHGRHLTGVTTHSDAPDLAKVIANLQPASSGG
jgi:hypothetical protein